ncbi:hypothetical protein LDENG_00034780 [Lucifuga dentata]|nr:hypothetical protein LDENG_00034780 [Lucifuga dentata]
MGDKSCQRDQAAAQSSNVWNGWRNYGVFLGCVLEGDVKIMSYVHRELVEFYLKYKLSQSNHPDWLLGAESASVGTEEEETSTSAAHGLTANSRTGSVHSGRSACGDIDAVKAALQETADEFEMYYKKKFTSICSQLMIKPSTAVQSFKSVLDELFKNGINWGRIVGLFVFGGALCVDCIERDMSYLVSCIADWMTIYLDEHISPWIHSQGGWDSFAGIYGKNAAAERRRQEENLRRFLLVGAVLLTGMLISTAILRKCL